MTTTLEGSRRWRLATGSQLKATTPPYSRAHSAARLTMEAGVAALVAKVLVIIFSAIMTKEAIGLLQMQIKSGQTSPGLHLPMTVPYFALVLSFAIITVVQIAMAIAMAKDFSLSNEELIAREKAEAAAEAAAYEKAVAEEEAKIAKGKVGGDK